MSAFKIRVVCVGRLKARYFEEAQAEYAKLLSRYCDLEITELREETPRGMGAAAEEKARFEEGRRMESRMDGFVIALDPGGKRMTSEEFARLLEKEKNMGEKVTFLIGGSTGLSREIIERADLALSFSDMTMPHHLFRIVLLEQIYRAMKINRGETYHK